ncbi:hypothetical protein HDU98_007755 [Podochytrium sp. JEL0797]|nr:hypothetical protein HDU98_007755 [Podochytrium sp. JEL0797]
MDDDDYDSDEPAPTSAFSLLALPQHRPVNEAQSQPAPATAWNPMMALAPIVITQPERVEQPEEEEEEEEHSIPSLKFSDLFAPRLRFTKPVVNKKLFKKPPQRNQIYHLSRNDVEVFLGRIQQTSAADSQESWGIYTGRRWKDDIEEREIFLGKNLPPSLDPVVLDPWEDKIIWDDEEDVEMGGIASKKEDDPRDEHARLLIRNTALDREEWTDAIIWDDDDNFVPPPLIINDPTIVLDLQGNAAANETASKVEARVVKNLFPIDKFNLSNDQYYINSSKNDEVRSTQGNAILKHSKAAIEMMFPHYKTQLNTQELRNFHRPPIKLFAGEDMRFARVKGYKKKKNSADPIEDSMNLTLKDSTNYVLLEYTEEYPPILSNFGMGTLLQNFYRKKNDKDLFAPKLDIGQHSPLEKIDSSPFNNFGDVPVGQVIQGITNNLIRAPIFRHEIPTTDFLLIRHTYNGKTKYYLRDVPFLFVVGQTYPQQEVPRPQSRKVLNLTKARLHSIAFRLMLRNPNQRMWYQDLQKYFVGQSDAVVRQRLREVAQNYKKGENTGWYKVKQSKVLPTEEELQKIITPEWCCLLETAFAGEQRLKDIGYANLDLGQAPGAEEDDATGAAGGNQEESSTDLEIQMAPWISTKNFVMTIQGKGMVQLYGGGDPTGCGEGFSFIRQSMKEMFYREGEAPPPSALKTPKNLVRFSYAEQQVVYKEEIRRIWNAQFKSLSSKTAPDLSTEEELGEQDDEDEDKGEKSDSQDKLQTVSKPHKDDDAMSVAGSLTSTVAKKDNRTLVIKRMVYNNNGELEWKSELIQDQRVINAYLRHQVQIQEQALAAAAPPPDEPETTKRVRRKKLPDTVITDVDAPPVPGPSSSSSTAQPLKFKFSLSEKTKPPPPSPELELSRIFEMIVSSFIAMPESQIFCFPVDKTMFPDYHKLIGTPICLEDIRMKCGKLKYKTAEEFSRDILLIWENSNMYNGPEHPLSSIASQFTTKANKSLKQFSADISRLENEIAQKNANPPQPLAPTVKSPTDIDLDDPEFMDLLA